MLYKGVTPNCHQRPSTVIAVTRGRSQRRRRRSRRGARGSTGRLPVTDESTEALEAGHMAWNALADEREARSRARDYYWGDQWRDTITDERGNEVTEEQYIKEQGRIPWRMNQIKPTVRNLKGQLRQNESDRQAFAVNRSDNQAAEMMTVALRQVRRLNEMKALEADGFQEHIIGGKAAFRLGYGWRAKEDRSDVLIQQVHPNRIFYNSDLSDRRLMDLRLVGQVHDLAIEEVIQSFAPHDRERADSVRKVYGGKETYGGYAGGMDTSEGFLGADSIGFFSPMRADMCRVIEVWRKEGRWKTFAHDPATGRRSEVDLGEGARRRENRMRRQRGLPPIRFNDRYEEAWVGYFLTPEGHVLWRGETPYAHQESPFVLGFADFIDGQAKGIVDDLIDQQRLYNRMISVMDLSMSSAARGVLMIPEEMIPAEMTADEFADEYTKVNGVIVYSAKQGGKAMDSGFKPQQVYSNSIPQGAFEWLGQMKKGIQEVSGVTEAVMGETPSSGTPAALYKQQILQGNTTNIDFFETYLETLRKVDLKALSLATQFYGPERSLRTDDGRVYQFDPTAARDLEYDVAVANVADTAVYRQLYEQDLKELLQSQRLTFSQYLQMSSHPKAESLMKLIERTNPIMQQAGGSPGAAGEAAAAGGVPAARPQPRGQGKERPQPRGASSAGGQGPRAIMQQVAERAEAGDRDAKALMAQAA